MSLAPTPTWPSPAWRGLAAAAINLLILSPVLLLAGEPPPIGAMIFLLLAALFAYSEASCQQCDDAANDMFVPALLTGVATLGSFVMALATASPAHYLVLMAGACLGVVGIWMRRQSMLALGHQFQSSVRSAAQETLATSGIHGRLRHPSETGLLLIVASGALLCGSVWALLVGIVVLLPLVLLRLRREEQQLLALYGERYARYARRVPGLVPR